MKFTEKMVGIHIDTSTEDKSKTVLHIYMLYVVVFSPYLVNHSIYSSGSFLFWKFDLFKNQRHDATKTLLNFPSGIFQPLENGCLEG